MTNMKFVFSFLLACCLSYIIQAEKERLQEKMLQSVQSKMSQLEEEKITLSNPGMFTVADILSLILY